MNKDHFLNQLVGEALKRNKTINYDNFEHQYHNFKINGDQDSLSKYFNYGESHFDSSNDQSKYTHDYRVFL